MNIQTGTCWHCKEVDSPGTKLQRCAGCVRAAYCCREHQKADWSNHRKMCQPFKLIQQEGKPYLTTVSRRALQKGDKTCSGEYLLHLGVLNLESESGYIENVAIYHEFGMAVGRARIHRDALRSLCGAESVPLVEHVLALSGSAFLLSGGDMSRAQDGPGLHSLLHIITLDPEFND